jgi:hypothetical protein
VQGASISGAVLHPTIARRLRAALPGASLQRYGWLYRLALLAAGVAAAVWSLRAVWVFTIDDAGISFAYAKHIADGDGPVAVIGGPRVEGYSNPLWVFALVPWRWLGLDLIVVSKLLGVLAFAAANLAGFGLIAAAQGRRARAFGAAEVCLAALGASCLELVVWVPAGLENALFGALLLGLLFLDARESQQPERWGLSGLAGFALSITRPEGALYAAPIVLFKLLRALARREPRRQAVAAALLFAVPLALYHLGHFLVFRHWLPNTYLAKPGGRELSAGLAYLLENARQSGLLWVTPLALIGLYGQPRLKLPCAWVWLAGVTFVLYSGGDWMPHARFLSLFAPAVLVLAALGLQRLSQLAARSTRGALPVEAVAFGLAVAVGSAWGRYQAPRLAQLRREGWCHFCERVADSQRLQRLATQAELPAHSLVTQDFGGPSWSSDQRFYPIDFLGLCDRSAALLRRERQPGGLGNDIRLYQYFIHEQSSAPSWIAMPPNFWPRFDHSPEYALDYFPLPARLLPRARRDSFFVLHRGELVDYFPPLPSAGLSALPEQLALVGFGLFADPVTPSEELAAHAPVLAVLSVVARGALRGDEQLVLRVDAGAQSWQSGPRRLDRGIEGVARGLARGEPLGLEFSLVLPAAAAASYRVSLGVGHAGASKGQGPSAPAFVELGSFAAGTRLAPLSRELPPYPSDLPAPLVPELLALRAPVTLAIARARRQGQPPADAPLAERLMGVGRELEAQGQLEQAYLADVWATQVWRRAWESLADPVFRLRDAARGAEHATEIALLRRYYASGDADELSRLVAFYLSASRPLEAGYFAARWPRAAPEPELARVARDAARGAAAGAAPFDASALAPLLESVAFDPLAGALDFERDTLGQWQGDRAAFGRASRMTGPRGLRGEHGQFALSSRAQGERGRGTLTSAEFSLSGRVLSLLVGGGSSRRRVGVQLLVDGRVAFSASGNDSENLLPVFWEIGPLAGKPARLRVFDQSAKDHVLIDRVLLWR